MIQLLQEISICCTYWRRGLVNCLADHTLATYLTVESQISLLSGNHGFFHCLMFFIVIVMVFVSWFRFGLLFHVYTAAAVPLLNNFLAGMVFVNTFQFAGEGLGVVERRFCRAFLTGALWAANLAVALIGLTVEYHLREHCLYVFEDVFCFTRSPTARDPSASCVF